MDVPAITVNKVCLSGLAAIAMADQLSRAGECDVVVAGGMESMNCAPHLLPGSRAGFKYGDVTLLDHMAFDGLRDAFSDEAMAALTEQRSDDEPITRLEQDTCAARSHQRAAAAVASGLFAKEIMPVTVPGRKGSVVVDTDVGICPETTVKTLAKLRPAFLPDGTITAGSASPITDGAAAVVVMRKEVAEARGLTRLAEIEGYGVVAGPDSSLQLQPANAIRAACARTGIDVEQLDLVEINEAFAAVGIASARDLEVSEDRINVNGGALALGHPIGASGARLVFHLALELARRGGGIGAGRVVRWRRTGRCARHLRTHPPCRSHPARITRARPRLRARSCQRLSPLREAPDPRAPHLFRALRMIRRCSSTRPPVARSGLWPGC